MVSSDRVTVYLDVETDDSLAELADFSRKVDEVGSKWQKIKQTVVSEARNILMSLNSLISLVKNILQAAGMSLGAIGDTLLTIIQQVVATASSIVVVYTALGLANPLFWISASIAAVGLGIAIGAEIRAAQGVEEAKKAASAANQILGNIQGMMSPWR